MAAGHVPSDAVNAQCHLKTRQNKCRATWSLETQRMELSGKDSSSHGP